MPNRPRILLVEDDSDLQAALSEILTNEGYSVTTADDGQQAMDMLRQADSPDILLVDLMLPRVSGFELLQHVQNEPGLRNMPTVVITAVPRARSQVSADAVLQKPLDLPELLSAVRDLTRDSRLESDHPIRAELVPVGDRVAYFWVSEREFVDDVVSVSSKLQRGDFIVLLEYDDARDNVVNLLKQHGVESDDLQEARGSIVDAARQFPNRLLAKVVCIR